MSAIALAVVSGIGLIANIGMGMKANNDAKDQAREERKERRRRDAEIKALERSRQQVIDKSDDIRALADSVVNPYQNLGVAMQGVNIRMEETDEALANTLDALNRSGVGAGAATQLARQAAASKAQVAASIENQELKNQQMYLSGEAQKRQQQLSLEQQAIQEEIGVYGRQEIRDVQQLNRLAGLSQNAAQRASDYQAGGNAALMAGISGATQSLGTFASALGSGSGGGNAGGSTGSSGYNPYSYSSGFTNPNSLGSNSTLLGSSDLRLKKNISKIGKSESGLNIYKFNYIDKEGTYQGVMSNEVPKEAVLVDVNGYDVVDYSKVDVDFKRIK